VSGTGSFDKSSVTRNEAPNSAINRQKLMQKKAPRDSEAGPRGLVPERAAIGQDSMRSPSAVYIDSWLLGLEPWQAVNLVSASAALTL